MEENKIVLTNLCMVYKEDGSFLVQLRKKNDWPGINFPGGHVESEESIPESVLREMKEETGLAVRNLVSCGYFEWLVPEGKVRHLSLLFKTKDYSGTLRCSEEGPMLWLREEDLKEYPLSTDFLLLYEQMKRY